MKFQQIKPQKARGILKPAMWTDPAWVAEEKYDGDRRIAQFCGSKVRFTGTRESVDGTGFVEKSDNLPQFHEAPKSLDGTVLDGEIVVPGSVKTKGGKSKYVTSVMGSSSEEAVRKQKEHGWLEYMVFDCLWWQGVDARPLPLNTRRAYAARALKAWGNRYASLALQVTKDKKAVFDRILQAGGEGVILKHKDHTYGNEKLWVKVKGEWTADVVIMGFEPGKGKYKGQVGAIMFGQNVIPPGNRGYRLRPYGTCSGFPDSMRRTMTYAPNSYLNQVIEIKHNGREPTGAFRHPRFKRFRSDKSPKDCVYREDET